MAPWPILLNQQEWIHDRLLLKKTVGTMTLKITRCLYNTGRSDQTRRARAELITSINHKKNTHPFKKDTFNVMLSSAWQQMSLKRFDCNIMKREIVVRIVTEDISYRRNVAPCLLRQIIILNQRTCTSQFQRTSLKRELFEKSWYSYCT